MDEPRKKEKINWEEIKDLVDEKYRVFFEQIDPELFEYVLEEKNHDQVVSSVSRMMLLNHPNETTPKRIDEIVTMMERVAKDLYLKEK